VGNLDTINIPSIGQAEVLDYAEGQAVRYTAMDTGNFTFSINKYKSSATYITEKMKQDSFYSAKLASMFVPSQARAIQEHVETTVLGLANTIQTTSNLNTINGADHRWIGSGPNETIALEEFFRAQFALTKAQVPLNNLVAILDPTTAFALQMQTNAVNLLSPMPMYEDVLKNNIMTGFRFRYNFAGFDCYVSNYLRSGIAETIDGRTSTAGIANLFFSASPGDTMPIIGGFRQIIASEGAGALLTGLGPTAQGYFIQGWFKFGGVEFFKIYFCSSMGEQAAWNSRTSIYLASAAIAEFIADIFLCP
jgi:hypothetical protein